MSAEDRVNWPAESYFAMDLYTVEDLITALETGMCLFPAPLSLSIAHWNATNSSYITAPVVKSLIRWTKLIEGRKEEENSTAFFILACNFKLPFFSEQRQKMVVSLLELSTGNCIWDLGYKKVHQCLRSKIRCFCPMKVVFRRVTENKILNIAKRCPCWYRV